MQGFLHALFIFAFICCTKVCSGKGRIHFSVFFRFYVLWRSGNSEEAHEPWVVTVVTVIQYFFDFCKPERCSRVCSGKGRTRFIGLSRLGTFRETEHLEEAHEPWVVRVVRVL